MGLHINASQGLRTDDLPELQDRVRLRGGRLVVYAEVLSAFMFCVRSYRIRWVAAPNEQRNAGRPSSLLSGLLGWWSLFGPFHTISALVWNSRGGVDVTDSLLKTHAGSKLPISGSDVAAFSAYEKKVRSTAVKLFWSIVLLLAALFAYLVWKAAPR